MIKKDLIIAILGTFCLTSALFMVLPTRSSTTNGPKYDPWLDLDDDGYIGLSDLVSLAKVYGTTGTPINKTELLLNVNATYTKLLSRINSLNASLLDLEAYLKTRITNLEALVAEQQSIIAELESKIAILNATKLGTPDYDSGWFYISNGGQVIKTHNLGTTNVLVFMVGKYSSSSSPYIHQRFYGGEETWPNYWGAYWQDLTETTIRVIRQGQDEIWNYVRVMIWKIPEP